MTLYPYFALAALLTIGGAYVKGRMDCSANAQVAGLRAERDTLAARIQAIANVNAAEAARAAADQIELERLRSLANVTPSNDAACLPADAARRVRNVR